MTTSKEKLLQQIESLKIFPNNKLVRELRKQIIQKLERLEKKQKLVEPISPLTRKLESNLARAGKLRRYHNYMRQIRNNYPNLTYSQIRNEFAKRKQNQESGIPDVVWQNPSP